MSSDDPLTEAWRRALGLGAGTGAARDEAIRRFGFAIPSEDALIAIVESSPRGIVEIGAGTGYWANLLSERGVDVVAFDVAPSSVGGNQWFEGSPEWHPVEVGDHHRVAEYADRTLLLVWPTKDETWPVETLDLYAEAGGSTVAYVGEGPGGRTGDAAFHARLGETSTCLACAHGVADVPCVCEFDARWERAAAVDIPTWPGFDDRLHLYRRSGSSRPRRWRRSSR